MGKVGSVLKRLGRNKPVLGVVCTVVILAVVYIGLTVTANNKFHALLNGWDSKRSDQFNSQVNLMAEVGGVTDKFFTVSAADNPDAGMLSQGSSDARTVDQHLQQAINDQAVQEKTDIADFHVFRDGFWSHFLTGSQKDLLKTLPEAETAELPKDQDKVELSAFTGYMVNYFDLITGMQTYLAGVQADDINTAWQAVGGLQKYADSDQLYADGTIKTTLPATYKSFKAGVNGLGTLYKALKLGVNPNITQAEYNQYFVLYAQARDNIQTFVNGQDDSSKEIEVLSNKDFSQTDPRIYQALNDYTSHKQYRFFTTVKANLNVNKEVVQAISDGVSEYQSNTSNPSLNPNSLDELVATLKSKGVVTWLPDKYADLKLVKHDEKAFVQFGFRGQQRELFLYYPDGQANPNQST